MNQLISVYQINIYGQERSKKREFFPFGCGSFRCYSIERADVVVCFSFFSVCCFDRDFPTAKDDTFVRLILGDAYVDKTLENIETERLWGFIRPRTRWICFL